MFVLLGMFYVGPWLTWAGRQAILFDLPARKFYIFGLTLWPQDFIYLALLLIILAVSLFFFTAIAGRVWCGFACPQTVWTEAFSWIERLIEGDRSKRIKLDKAPWSANKIRERLPSKRPGLRWPCSPDLPSSVFLCRCASSRAICSAFPAAAGSFSGCCSTASPLTATRVSCVSRSANTCAPTRASRARCSTKIR